MDNKEINEVKKDINPKKKNKKILFTILGMVLIIIISLTTIMLNSPKVKAKLILGKAESVFTDFTKLYNNDLMKLFESESHKSETKVNVDMTLLKVKGDIKTAYNTKTNSGLMELSLMDFISLGAYINQDEFALDLSRNDEMMVYDFQSETVFEEGMTLFEHLNKLTPRDEFKKYESVLREKMIEYSNKSISIIPSKNITNVKKLIIIHNEKRNVKGIEITFTGDELAKYLEELLKMIKEDEKLKEIYDAGILDVNNEIASITLTDYESAIDELINDLVKLKDIDELTMAIYYMNFKPIAINVKVIEDTFDIELLYTFYIDNSNFYFALDGDYNQEYDTQKINVVASRKNKDIHILLHMADANINANLNIVEDEKDHLSIDGMFKFDNEYLGKYEVEISGEVTNDAVNTEGVIKITYFENNNKMLNVLLDYNTEEIRHNKNYMFDANLVVSMEEQDITISLENEIMFGDEIIINIPTWSKSNDKYYNDIDAFTSDLEKYLFPILRMF